MQRTVQDELQRATNAIVNTCVLLNEFPLIRYYAPHHLPLGPLAPPPSVSAGQDQRHSVSLRDGLGRLGRSSAEPVVPPPASEVPTPRHPHFTQLLAENVTRALDKYVADNEVKRDTGRSRGIMVITDRTMDVRAPLVHEFSYQAMANDLLPIQHGRHYRHTYINAAGQEEETDVQLTEDDALWVDVRHLHIANVADRLSAELEQHMGKAAKYREGKSVNDLRDLLANLPSMTDAKGELSLHVALAERCLDMSKTTQLREQSRLEQAFATRLNADGTKVKSEDVVQQLLRLLGDPGVSLRDKERLVALYILWNESGVVDTDRRNLFQHARLGPTEMEGVNNLTFLGAKVVRQSAGSAERALARFNQLLGKSAVGGWKRDQEYVESDLDTARFKPLVQYLLKDLLNQRLDTLTFPWVEGHGDNTPVPGTGFSLAKRVQSPLTGGGSSPQRPQRPPLGAPGASLRSQRPTWATSSRRQGSASGSLSNGKEGTRQRVLIYVVGGMTYSEMRAAYTMGDTFQRDVYIGSDTVWTPALFLNQVSALANPRSLTRPGPVPGPGALAGATVPSAPLGTDSAPPAATAATHGAYAAAGPTRPGPGGRLLARAGVGGVTGAPAMDRPDPRDGRTRVDPRDPTKVDYAWDQRARMWRESHREKQLPHVSERVSRHMPDLVKRRLGKEPKALPSVAAMPQHQRIRMQRQTAAAGAGGGESGSVAGGGAGPGPGPASAASTMSGLGGMGTPPGAPGRVAENGPGKDKPKLKNLFRHG